MEHARARAKVVGDDAEAHLKKLIDRVDAPTGEPTAKVTAASPFATWSHRRTVTSDMLGAGARNERMQ